MGLVWAKWPLGADDVVGDLKRVAVFLFRQRPGAILELTQWMERRSKFEFKRVLELFREICEQARETTQL